jgi:hypothetical protein
VKIRDTSPSMARLAVLFLVGVVITALLLVLL